MASPNLFDQQCELIELFNHAITAKWYELGIELELRGADLDIIQNDPAKPNKIFAMYTLWINKKGRDATHQTLINALKSNNVGEINLAQEYKDWLENKVSTCMNQGISGETEAPSRY